jgi:hypothetical protein
MGTPRGVLGRRAKAVTYESFAEIVYNHTAHSPRGRMGNYSRDRLPEQTLREIFQFTRDLGFRASITGTVHPDSARGYIVTVENIGDSRLGLEAEDVTIHVIVPEEANVLSTAAGFSGLREVSNGIAAVWRIPSIQPGGKVLIQFELVSDVPTQFTDSTVHWSKPESHRPQGMTLRDPRIPRDGDSAPIVFTPAK